LVRTHIFISYGQLHTAYLDSNADSANRVFLNEYDAVKYLSNKDKPVYRPLAFAWAKLLADLFPEEIAPSVALKLRLKFSS
jgi:hypothetical protein